jgi:hypothetical protein
LNDINGSVVVNPRAEKGIEGVVPWISLAVVEKIIDATVITELNFNSTCMGSRISDSNGLWTLYMTLMMMMFT